MKNVSRDMRFIDAIFLIAIGALLVIDWPHIVEGLRNSGIIK